MAKKHKLKPQQMLQGFIIDVRQVGDSLHLGLRNKGNSSFSPGQQLAILRWIVDDLSAKMQEGKVKEAEKLTTEADVKPKRGRKKKDVPVLSNDGIVEDEIDRAIDNMLERIEVKEVGE